MQIHHNRQLTTMTISDAPNTTTMTRHSKTTLSSIILCICLACTPFASAGQYLPATAFVSQRSHRRSADRRPVFDATFVTPQLTTAKVNPTATRLYLNGPTNSTNFLDSRSRESSSSSTELDASLSEVADIIRYKVYCDLDGVLVDFERGVRKLLKAPTSQLVKGTMWKHIARANAFYEDLDWTRDGKRLWHAIRPLSPDILTGVPYPKASRQQKYNWCKRELGVEEVYHVDMAAGCRDHEPVNGNMPKEGVTNIITCWSNNKHMECSYRSILIDDRDSLRESWEAAGGIFVHHVDAETTIQMLKDYGVLGEDVGR